jgi:hypothetical protein
VAHTCLSATLPANVRGFGGRSRGDSNGRVSRTLADAVTWSQHGLHSAPHEGGLDPRRAAIDGAFRREWVLQDQGPWSLTERVYVKARKTLEHGDWTGRRLPATVQSADRGKTGRSISRRRLHNYVGLRAVAEVGGDRRPDIRRSCADWPADSHCCWQHRATQVTALALNMPGRALGQLDWEDVHVIITVQEASFQVNMQRLFRSGPSVQPQMRAWRSRVTMGGMPEDLDNAGVLRAVCEGDWAAYAMPPSELSY